VLLCIFVLAMVLLYSSFLTLLFASGLEGTFGLSLGVGLCFVLAADSSSWAFALTLILISLTVLV